MREVLEAAAIDTAQVAVDSGVFARVILAADRPPSGDVPAGLEVRVDATRSVGTPFRFGPAFVEVAEEVGAGVLAYVGAGSGPLLREGDFEALVAPLRRADAATACATNNRFSSDLFALADPRRVADLDPAADKDNAIPRRLRDEHGFEVVELPRTLETQFNLDTPSDALALALSGRGGPRLTAALDGVPAAERMQRAAREGAFLRLVGWGLVTLLQLAAMVASDSRGPFLGLAVGTRSTRVDDWFIRTGAEHRGLHRQQEAEAAGQEPVEPADQAAQAVVDGGALGGIDIRTELYEHAVADHLSLRNGWSAGSPAAPAVRPGRARRPNRPVPPSPW